MKTGNDPMTEGAKTGTDAEQAAFEEWLAATYPSGDAEAVHRQWRESSDYADFLEHHPLWSTMRNKLDDLLRDETSNTYVCGRVWHAWSVGTMSEDDFTKFDSGDRIEQLVYEIEAICEERIQEEKAALDASLTEALKVAGEALEFIEREANEIEEPHDADVFRDFVRSKSAALERIRNNKH